MLRFCLLLVLFIFSAVFVCGQDLGSSSDLFKSPKTKTKSADSSSTTKKTTSKTSAASKKKAAPKSSVAAGKTTKETKKSVKKETISSSKKQTPVKQSSAKQNVQPQIQDVVITVGKTNEENYDERFEQAIEDGNAARDEREYVKAENAYRRALNMKNADSRAIYGLGNLYSDQQRWDEAEKAYREAIKIDPQDAGASIALSFVLTQPIVGADLADRYSEAEKLARRAIQIEPQNPFAYDQLGVALELRGVIGQETENAYRKAIQIEPNSALAYAHLGRLLRRKGQVNASSEAYRRAIQLAADVPTMILVAEVMQSQQRYLESEQLLRRALRLDAKNPTALFLLGRALTTRSSFEEAEETLKKGLRVSPNNFVAYTLLGSLYTRQGNLAEAEKTLFKALQVVSPNEKKRLAQEFEAVGDSLARVGKSKDAARMYSQAVQLDAEKPALAEKLSRVRGS